MANQDRNIPAHTAAHRFAGPASPLRRSMLKRLAGAGLGAATLFAWPGSTFALAGGTEDEAAQAPIGYPPLFGYKAEAAGTPPAGFFTLSHGGVMRHAPPDLDGWRTIDPHDRLSILHRRFSQAPYRPGPIKRSLSPSGHSPARFLSEGGDGEDHALARYTALSHLGFHQDRLRIVALRLPASRRATPERHLHAVLCVYLGGDVLVLDNLQADIYRHEQAVGCRPLFSFNHRRKWRHRPHPEKAGFKVDPA